MLIFQFLISLLFVPVQPEATFTSFPFTVLTQDVFGSRVSHLLPIAVDYHGQQMCVEKVESTFDADGRLTRTWVINTLHLSSNGTVLRSFDNDTPPYHLTRFKRGSWDLGVMIGFARDRANFDQFMLINDHKRIITLADTPGGETPETASADAISGDGRWLFGTVRDVNGVRGVCVSLSDPTYEYHSLTPPGGDFVSVSWANSTGSKFVGVGPLGGILRGFLYENGNYNILPDVSGGLDAYAAIASSEDASVIVGQARRGNGQTVGVLWKAPFFEASTLFDVEGGAARYGPTSISVDGRVIAGYCRVPVGNDSQQIPVVWDENGKVQTLDVFLQRFRFRGGVNPPKLLGNCRVSPDGKTFFGMGIATNDRREEQVGWVIRIP